MSAIKLNSIDTKAPEAVSKEQSKRESEKMHEVLCSLQHLFYASHSHSLFIIFQGIDTSGKDSTINHVFSYVNPFDIHAISFKAPFDMEREHNYVLRIFQKLPEKGMIHIFNRSYNEDILVPTIQKVLPWKITDKRYNFMNASENHKLDNKTLVPKFFLQISEKEQKIRILERRKKPLKKWKYSEEDMKLSEKWNSYTQVYEHIFNRCSPDIIKVIIPLDNKLYRDYLMASTIV